MRRRAAGDPRQLGIGLASYVEITGFGGSEMGHVEVHEDGSATGRTVVGIEASAEAIASATLSARDAELRGVTFAAGDATAFALGGA